MFGLFDSVAEPNALYMTDGSEPGAREKLWAQWFAVALISPVCEWTTDSYRTARWPCPSSPSLTIAPSAAILYQATSAGLDTDPLIKGFLGGYCVSAAWLAPTPSVVVVVTSIASAGSAGLVSVKDQRTVNAPSAVGPATVGAAERGGSPQSTRVGMSAGAGKGGGMWKRSSKLLPAEAVRSSGSKQRTVTWKWGLSATRTQFDGAGPLP